MRRFVPGPAIDEYIAMVTAAGVRTFFHTDKMGSIVAMSDTGGNMVEGPYLYDGYGNCTQGGVACGAGVPFRYTGQRFDPETALYYYRARYYSATQGRFLQDDPIAYKNDLDMYNYVHDDPTDMTDPSGKADFGDDLLVAGAGGIAGVGGQILSDLWDGHVSSKGSYIGAFLGGAITADGTYNGTLLTGGIGAVAAYIVSGAIGSAIGEITAELIDGKDFSASKIEWATAIGGLTNIPGGVVIKGLTKGRNSYAAIAAQLLTKFRHGDITTMQLKTGLKALTGLVLTSTNSMALQATVTDVKKMLFPEQDKGATQH